MLDKNSRIWYHFYSANSVQNLVLGGFFTEELLRILSSLHPEVDFERAGDLIEEGILDSLDIVTLITEINNAFDVQIPAEEVIPENFESAKTIWALIQKLDEA